MSDDELHKYTSNTDEIMDEAEEIRRRTKKIVFQHSYYVKLVLGICVLLYGYAIGLPSRKTENRKKKKTKRKSE